MAKELCMSNTTLANAIKWLENNDLISRSDYSKRADGRYARRYYIPNEYWNYQCKKETGEQVNNLMDKASGS